MSDVHVHEGEWPCPVCGKLSWIMGGSFIGYKYKYVKCEHIVERPPWKTPEEWAKALEEAVAEYSPPDPAEYTWSETVPFIRQAMQQAREDAERERDELRGELGRLGPLAKGLLTERDKARAARDFAIEGLEEAKKMVHPDGCNGGDAERCWGCANVADIERVLVKVRA